MIVGRYVLHLRCDLAGRRAEISPGSDRCEVEEIDGAVQTRGEAVEEAKALGWQVSSDLSRCICPKCVHRWGAPSGDDQERASAE